VVYSTKNYFPQSIIEETPVNLDSDIHFGQSQITDGTPTLQRNRQRALKKGCPKMMKLVQLALDDLTPKHKKPIHQFVASPRKMTLGHSKYAIG
jgi:hypothetical protein